MQPVVFYAINGIGLGHIARLSVIQRHLAEHVPELPIEAYSRSEWGSSFFSCPCVYTPTRGELKAHLGIKGIKGRFNVLRTRLSPSLRKTLIFDTYWPERIVKRLKLSGHRRILVMQSFRPEPMYETLCKAVEQFDQIFFPCEQEELEYHYRSHDKLWKLIENNPCEAIGPFVRQTDKYDDDEKVIFTLGGGGEHENEDPAHGVVGHLKCYVEAARILHEAGKKNLYVAKGPLMKETVELGDLEELETMNLPDLFGQNTCVVTRGTYNLGWETIAAGSKLVTTTRSSVSRELADGRSRYLVDRGYAYNSKLNGEALAEAILRERPAHLDRAAAVVNAREGLTRLADFICG